MFFVIEPKIFVDTKVKLVYYEHILHICLQIPDEKFGENFFFLKKK